MVNAKSRCLDVDELQQHPLHKAHAQLRGLGLGQLPAARQLEGQPQQVGNAQALMPQRSAGHAGDERADAQSAQYPAAATSPRARRPQSAGCGAGRGWLPWRWTAWCWGRGKLMAVAKMSKAVNSWSGMTGVEMQPPMLAACVALVSRFCTNGGMGAGVVSSACGCKRGVQQKNRSCQRWRSFVFRWFWLINALSR